MGLIPALPFFKRRFIGTERGAGVLLRLYCIEGPLLRACYINENTFRMIQAGMFRVGIKMLMRRS